MINLNSVSFGTDAELFLRTIDGRPIPVCGMVGGTKAKPQPLEVLGKDFAVQEDNAAIEFNVPAIKSFNSMAANVENTLRVLEGMLPDSVALDMTHASVIFNENYLKIPKMMSFGCEADYNAWTEKTNGRPVPHVAGFRSAAAHVHIGWENPIEEDCYKLVRFSDVYAVLPTIAKQGEDEADRRKLYGRAGAFRLKSYGCEHRVLANKWILNRWKIISTLRNYIHAILALNGGVEIDKEDEIRIVQAINQPHAKLAVVLHEKYFRRLLEKVSSRQISEAYEFFA